MGVSVEAFDARKGDAFLVRIGSETDPVLWLIDGGPSGTYSGVLRPRLKELRTEFGVDDDDDESLQISLVVVSHIDDDHVHGVIDLASEIVDADVNSRPRPWQVARLWHNSFDIMMDSPSGRSLKSSMESDVERLGPDFAARAASINQGRRLSDLARRLGKAGNPPFNGLLVANLKTFLDGAEVTVISPPEHRLVELADKWESEVGKCINRHDLARAAAYVDASISNLSSIGLHLSIADHTILLTGDARGDDLLSGLHSAQLVDKNGVCHVDLLKVPHHGSERNVDEEFFEQIVADHYLISADGTHGNPSHQVLDWIVATQRGREYQIHLTYGGANGAVDYLKDLRQASTSPAVNSRTANALALTVDLFD